jgi:hypothetical protein
MNRSLVLAAVGVAVIWAGYLALQQSPVARLFQREYGAAFALPEVFQAAGSTQGIDTILCPRTATHCAPIRLRGLTLLLGQPFITYVDASTTVQVDLLYNDTIARPRLLADSVGIRLLGAEGALAIQPSEARYSGIRARMGPWQWIITPQRVGYYEIMLEFVRLPGDLDELLQMPDTVALKRQQRTWTRAGQTRERLLHRTNIFSLRVLTAAGWTAEQEAKMKIVAWILTFSFAALPIREYLQRRSGRA